MKIAVLSDIHANVLALDACIADARALGVSQFVLLGDFVGYGPAPCEVVARVRELVAEGAVAIKGNHDVMACEDYAVDGSTWGGMTALWTRAQLSALDKQLLNDLPMEWTLGGLYFTHASAYALGKWHYVDSARAAQLCLGACDGAVTHVFVGHVHHQNLYYSGRSGDILPFTPAPGVPIPTPAHRRWLCTVGSAGQPRDGDTRAMYVIYDTQMQQLNFRRVAYNHHEVAQMIRLLGLPEALAFRMEVAQ